MGAVVVLGQDVAVVVVGGPGAAAAAAVLVVARAAGAGVGLGAQALEHWARLPNLVEGPHAHIAGFLGHVGARTHDPLAAHDAVGEPRQAAAGKAGFHAQLLGHAGELRRAGGLHVDGHFRRLLHDLAKERLVFQHFQTRLLDVLAAADGDQEEDVVGLRANLFGEIGDGAHLVAVPIDHGGVQLEGQAGALAGLDAGQGEGVGVREAAELVVLGGIQAVHGDAHGAGARLLQTARHLIGDERAVAAEHRAQAAGGRMGHQLVDVGTQKRLATGEDHDLEAREGNLVDHLLRLVGGKLAVGGLLGVLVAVHAFQVALVRGHPRYDHVGVSSPSHGRGRRFGSSLAAGPTAGLPHARPQRGFKDTQSVFRGNRPNGLGWE